MVPSTSSFAKEALLKKKRKIKLFRSLGNDLDDDVDQEMTFRIVQTLVTFSKGKEPNDDNKSLLETFRCNSSRGV